MADKFEGKKKDLWWSRELFVLIFQRQGCALWQFKQSQNTEFYWEIGKKRKSGLLFLPKLIIYEEF